MTANFDVIVVGGGVAGLSACLMLSRCALKVLCIDSGKPCNSSVNHTHTFLTQEGSSASAIRDISRNQIEQYKKVEFYSGTVDDIEKLSPNQFKLRVNGNNYFITSQIVIASGVTDLLEESKIANLDKFWGHSVSSFAFSDGYDYKDKRAALINSLPGCVSEIAPLTSYFSKELTVMTNGGFDKNESDLSITNECEKNGVDVIHKEIKSLNGQGRKLKEVEFTDGSKFELDVIYYYPPFKVNGEEYLKKLGVEFCPELNLIKTDSMQKTNVPGICAAGDACTIIRSIPGSVAQGSFAGAVSAKTLFVEMWNK
ncbi:putative thioredoxin reductase Tcptp [[Candida] railenensis]|uniref:Thioredoxin reductase Tcptp n=1 Tax=[Candida] railenensis TaxID=45579 RepID=A0A9P0W072_9ASCO|nr:putative thioredoxin reductase Tcptp [[Candida] railenensis]